MGIPKQYVAAALIVALLGCSGGNAAEDIDTLNAQAISIGASTRVTNDSRRTLANDGRRTLTDDARRKTILFIGTSLTAGYGLDPDSAYPQQIQRMIDSAGLPFDAVNAGVSGETSAALLRRLDWLLRQPFDIAVIETGANDGLRGIPVEAMRSNVGAIVRRMREARPNARILLVRMEALPNLGSAYTRQFREVFSEVAKEEGITLLPFLLDSVAGHRELNQPDGIHPNYDGERIVARNVFRSLMPLLR